MKRLNCALLLASIVIFGTITCLAQGRINLVNGRRVVSDEVKFVVDVDRQDSSHSAPTPRMYLYILFGDRPATGVVYLDGKAITRFDESMGFNSNPVDISNGRHVMTLKFADPGVVTTFTVTIQGAAVREILEGESAVPTRTTGLEHRIVELERKVNALESQIAMLKRKPRK